MHIWGKKTYGLPVHAAEDQLVQHKIERYILLYCLYIYMKSAKKIGRDKYRMQCMHG